MSRWINLVLVVAGLAALLVGGAWLVVGRPELPMVGGRMSPVAYDAYRQAAVASVSITGSCDVRWEILAAIGQVESKHGRIDSSHAVAVDGTVAPAIRGQALNGTNGTQTIHDTDDGAFDGDATWDRAMGPLQFIPTTWSELGRDGNHDGVADPDNIYDAALTAAAHLCLREPGDYAVRAQLRRALIAYNASGEYADRVLAWVDRYASRPIDEVVEPG
ncbi:MAG: lytic transglycosylase domain-containing protein [Chloroflexi bacterium]|nr:lytic transglycosylase domain-containing protein [Chloroflexota bacterium]